MKQLSKLNYSSVPVLNYTTLKPTTQNEKESQGSVPVLNYTTLKLSKKHDEL